MTKQTFETVQIRKPIHIFLALIVVALVPYALFGKHKKLAGWLALINGIQISLALVFLEPLYLLTNPFIALAGVSKKPKETINAKFK